MIDWKRVARTAIQSAAGAGIAFISVIAAGMSKDALIAAGITFVTTVATAVLMNIQEQTK